MDYQEVQHLLIEALKFRRKYMELSLQEFCKTTSKMIDKMLPPSSDFCVMGSDIRVTPGGDILPCKWTSIATEVYMPYVCCITQCEGFMAVKQTESEGAA